VSFFSEFHVLDVLQGNVQADEEQASYIGKVGFEARTIEEYSQSHHTPQSYYCLSRVNCYALINGVAVSCSLDYCQFY
jgi:hypothetical protein